MAQAPLKAALIGVGAWGRVLASAAGQSAKIEFTCCAGRNPDKLAAFSRALRRRPRADCRRHRHSYVPL